MELFSELDLSELDLSELEIWQDRIYPGLSLSTIETRTVFKSSVTTASIQLGRGPTTDALRPLQIDRLAYQIESVATS